MSETVLVTGGFGLAGRDAVKQLAADGWHVVTTAHRTTDGDLPAGVQIRHVDLADTESVGRLVAELAPAAIVHLAAVIPPMTYRNPAVARRVNVDATTALVNAAERQPDPPRFVHASSCSIYGPRNPHRQAGPVNLSTEEQPCEHYGAQKLEAERAVRAAQLPWSILRLGSIMSADPTALKLTPDTMYFGSALPTDSRLHTVDTRDVAAAFAAAARADFIHEILFIAGDETHRVEVGSNFDEVCAAYGITRMPPRRPGNPDCDADWYPVGDWMDVARAQELLRFQRHSRPDVLDELQFNVGWKRSAARLAAPMIRRVAARRSPYRGTAGPYADVWTAVRSRFGEARTG